VWVVSLVQTCDASALINTLQATATRQMRNHMHEEVKHNSPTLSDNPSSVVQKVPGLGPSPNTESCSFQMDTYVRTEKKAPRLGSSSNPRLQTGNARSWCCNQCKCRCNNELWLASSRRTMSRTCRASRGASATARQ
jgi:hypothetical protein